AVLEVDPHFAGVGLWERRIGIDPILDLVSESENLGIGKRRVFDLGKSYAAAHQGSCDEERDRELRIVAVCRPLLVRLWLADRLHHLGRDKSLDFLDSCDVEPVLLQSQGGVDTAVSEMARRKRFDRGASDFPSFAEAGGCKRVVATFGKRPQVRFVEPETSDIRTARTPEALLGEGGRSNARGSGPAGMDPLVPRTVLEEFKAAGGEGQSDALRLHELAL